MTATLTAICRETYKSHEKISCECDLALGGHRGPGPFVSSVILAKSCDIISHNSRQGTVRNCLLVFECWINLCVFNSEAQWLETDTGHLSWVHTKRLTQLKVDLQWLGIEVAKLVYFLQGDTKAKMHSNTSDIHSMSEKNLGLFTQSIMWHLFRF